MLHVLRTLAFLTKRLHVIKQILYHTLSHYSQVATNLIIVIYRITVPYHLVLFYHIILSCSVTVFIP